MTKFLFPCVDKGPGLSKAAKKNLKKNARKKAAKSGTGKSGNSEETTHAELLSLLKVELENAKAKKVGLLNLHGSF